MKKIIDFLKNNKNIFILVAIILVTIIFSSEGYFRSGNNNFFISKIKQQNHQNDCEKYKSESTTYIKNNFGPESQIIDIFYNPPAENCIATFKNLFQQKSFYYILDLDTGKILNFESPTTTISDREISQNLFDRLQQQK